MQKILYVGNKGRKEGQNPTTIDTLALLLDKEGFTVISVSGISNKLFRLIHMLWKVIQLRNKVDVILIDTYSTLNFTYAVWVGWLSRFFNIPYIPILHGGNLPERLKRNPNACKKLFGNAFRNIAPSEYLKTVFTKYGFTNLSYIPNPIEITNFPFNARAIEKPIKLLWVRAFANLYNPMMAINVLQRLREKGIHVELTMIGPEKDSSFDECKQYVNLHSLPVHFFGAMGRDEWTELSKKYDIFLNTTTIDNTPLSVIEAMALGLPVVSTNVGGIPYLINNQEDGLTVPNNDIEAMMLAIEWLIKKPEEALAMSIKARKKVEKFSWDTVKEKWFIVLNS